MDSNWILADSGHEIIRSYWKGNGRVSYIPRQRDSVWIDFDSAKGYEIKKEDLQLSQVVLNII